MTSNFPSTDTISDDVKGETCFIIQPFDKGPFDRRYDETLAPAVRAANLTPYRVDRDLKASDVLDSIVSGIRGAAVCLADVTETNPNVWFELGYALACGKDVVLLADSSRKNAVPFDIYHKPIIFYEAKSPSDFAKLRTEVTGRLKAVMDRRTTTEQLADIDIQQTEGLSPAEFAVLVTLGNQHLDGGSGMSAHETIGTMRKAGFTAIAITLAVRRLMHLKLVASRENDSSYGDGEPYLTYYATDAGMDWLARNQDKLVLYHKTGSPESTRDKLDDIPF